MKKINLKIKIFIKKCKKNIIICYILIKYIIYILEFEIKTLGKRLRLKLWSYAIISKFWKKNLNGKIVY